MMGRTESSVHGRFLRLYLEYSLTEAQSTRARSLSKAKIPFD